MIEIKKADKYSTCYCCNSNKVAEVNLIANKNQTQIFCLCSKCLTELVDAIEDMEEPLENKNKNKEYKLYFSAILSGQQDIKEEIVDLIEDYNYTEEESEKIINNEDRIKELYDEWLVQNLDINYYVVVEENYEKD